MTDFSHRFERGTRAETVLALHGTGGNETDLIPLARSLFPGANVLAPRGRVRENGANRFFRRFAEGVFDLDDLRLQTHALADWVRESAQEYGFDGAKVWALGYSNGANIAASALLLRPETFAGAVLLRAMTPFEPEVSPDLSGKPVLFGGGRIGFHRSHPKREPPERNSGNCGRARHAAVRANRTQPRRGGIRIRRALA